MSIPAELERELRLWLLDEGPQDVPGRTVDAAIVEARLVRRQQPWPPLLTRVVAQLERRPLARDAYRARTLVAVLLATLLATALLAVGGGLRLLGPAAPLIAFDAGGDIWMVRADGSELRALTDTPAEEGDPTWSPDGRFLTYSVTQRDGSTSLRVVDAEGTHVRDLHAPEGTTFMPGTGIIGWSPDAQQLAAPARRSGPQAGGTLVLADVPVVFDVATGEGRSIELAFEASGFGWASPDGRWFGVLGTPNTQTAELGTAAQGQLLVMDEELGEVRPVVTEPEGYRLPRGPVFTPDGDAIVYFQEAPGRYDGDIYIVSAQGGEARPLITGPTNDLTPAVSPDGDRIAFSRSGAAGVAAGVTRWIAARADAGRSGAPSLVKPAEVWIASKDGELDRRVGEDLWTGPLWSPDGTQLSALSIDWREIVILDADGLREPLHIPSPGGAEIRSVDWQPPP